MTKDRSFLRRILAQDKQRDLLLLTLLMMGLWLVNAPHWMGWVIVALQVLVLGLTVYADSRETEWDRR